MKPTLPLRRWTPDEDARLRAWYGTHSARAIAAGLPQAFGTICTASGA